MTDLAETIRSIPIFSGLSREDIAKILGKMEEKTFSAGKIIFSQGDQGDSFYLIQSGAVKVVLRSAGGRSEAIAVLGPQEGFGEMALLSGEPRSATIIAVKDVALWRLSREDWDDLIEKHPTWLLHFCATLSKRLSRAEQQYSQSRDAFGSLAEEFYQSRSAEEQEFLRRVSLLTSIDPKTVGLLLQDDRGEKFLAGLEQSEFPLMHRSRDGRYELHGYFADFLEHKLLATEGEEGKKRLHAQLADRYESMEDWEQSIHHCIEIEEWGRVAGLVLTHKQRLLDGASGFLKNCLEKIPAEQLAHEPQLVHLKADVLAHLGDFPGAIRTYNEALSQKEVGGLSAQQVVRYRDMANASALKKDYPQALNYLRTALNLVGAENTTPIGDVASVYHAAPEQNLPPSVPSEASAGALSAGERFFASVAELRRRAATGRWLGGIIGVALCTYLWFSGSDLGLEQQAARQVALFSLALVFWIFWVFPEHGVALIFALGLILTHLVSPETIFSGFASTTWFMALGVLGLGAAITSSGLFYRLSLLLVKMFPLTYFWQTLALSLMGVVFTGLIPQKSARATILSPMILNLSESLGYKHRSRATTGLFAAAFLGMGQLNFLYLTGSTASLMAWGLLPEDVRARFTWGYWFLATIPQALVVIAIVLAGINFLYRPETQSKVSYRMVHNQLQILGPLSRQEWITFGILCLTVLGWLSVPYHGLHAAWISLSSFCVLINAGVFRWDTLKKGIDWEFLIYLGIVVSIPTLFTAAKIDVWLTGIFSPVILPFVDTPSLALVAIPLIGYLLKLVFTSRLTVITLVVALVPLSIDMEVSPWVITMAILMGSEIWFFRFQIDWHTMAYATTEGKAFTYSLMSRINLFFALAYIAALLVGIPYWRYLGLMG